MLFFNANTYELNRVTTLLQEIPWLFDDPQCVFPGFCQRPVVTLCIECNSTIHHRMALSASISGNLPASSEFGNYTVKPGLVGPVHSSISHSARIQCRFFGPYACWLIWTTSKFLRTKLIFQDFPNPGNFRKNPTTFKEIWEPCRKWWNTCYILT